jgi:hypothetical protein
MSRRPLTTSEDFLQVRQDFDKIPVIHVSYASNYLALLQCNLVEHPIVNIWEDLNTLRFLQHGECLPQVTSSHRDRIQQRFKNFLFLSIAHAFSTPYLGHVLSLVM